MTEPQRTVKAPVVLEGVGVHTGEQARLMIRSGEVDSGFRFRRADLADSPAIPADLDHVVATELGTSLGHEEVRVQTVEHVLAALVAGGIDNAVVELDGPEPPILDGSFRPYLDAVGRAGIVSQDAPAIRFRVTGPVRVSLPGGARYEAVPASEWQVSATIDFEHPMIGRQSGHFEIMEDFGEGIAPARTFGFHRDADGLRARGLALGASLENTIVLGDDDILNDGLIFPDEFLRHKVGDLVGDLALLGGRVQGLIVVERPSHKGNIALARLLRERASRGEPRVDVQKLMDYLPHRYPMLLVDRIIDFEPEKRIVGLKNVTINEPFFQGHFPGHPIMPGVLLVEAMAQVGGLLLMESEEDPQSKVVYFVAIDNVKFRKPVTPGDQIVFELELVQYKRRICKMRGVGRVDGNTVVEGDLMASVMDR